MIYENRSLTFKYTFLQEKNFEIRKSFIAPGVNYKTFNL